MLMNTVGIGPENDYAAEIHQQLQTIHPSSRHRGCPTAINPQLYNSNKILSCSPEACLIIRYIGRLTVCRNITLTFCRCCLLLKLKRLGTVWEPRGKGTSVIGIRYSATAVEISSWILVCVCVCVRVRVRVLVCVNKV
jgi:hypothetical protein